VLTKDRAKERARQIMGHRPRPQIADTRCEGVGMFRLRTALRSVAVITLTVAVSAAAPHLM
jgi:hypothetical protein